MGLKKYSKEDLQETALIEVAFAILQEKKQPLSFQELVDELRKIYGYESDEMTEKMIQFYTDLNLDGRFLNLGENRWGLRTWYPVEQAEEEIITPIKTKKKKKKKVADDEFDEIEEEEFDVFDEDEELLDDEDDDDLEDDEDLEEEDEEFDEEFDDELVEDDEDLELEDEDDEELEDDEDR